MQRESPHALLIRFIGSLERCRTAQEVFELVPGFLSESGVEFGTLSVCNEDGTASVVQVSETCETDDLNRLLKPLGSSFEHLGHSFRVKDQIWHDLYYRGQTLVSDNILLTREHINSYRAPWQDCLVSYFQKTPVDSLLNMIGIRPVLHAIGINQIAMSPFIVKDRLTGAILIWGSQSKPIDDSHVEALQIASRVVGLALGGILRSQALKRTLTNVEIAETQSSRMIQNAPVGIMQIDLTTGLILPMNEAIFTLTGYSREELILMDPMDMLAHESQQSCRERLATLRQGIAPHGGASCRIIRKDGTDVWVYMMVRLATQEGNPGRAEIFLTDITHLKQQERVLRQRVATDAVMFKVASAFTELALTEPALGIGQALATIGQHAKLNRCYFAEFDTNASTIAEVYEWYESGLEPQVFRLKGRPFDSLHGWMERLNRFDFVLVPDTETAAVDARIEKEILQFHGASAVLFQPVVAGWGLIGFLGLAAAHSLEDLSPATSDLLPAVSDIIAGALERGRAQQALRDGLDRYRAMVHAAHDAILLLDESSRVVFCNPATEILLGHSLADITGTPVSELFYPGRYRETFARLIHDLRDDLARGKTGQVIPLTVFRSDSSEIPIEISLSPVHMHSNWWIVGVIRAKET